MHRGESLLFIKYHDGLHKRLTFYGTIDFSEYDEVSTRLPSIRKLCNLDDKTPIRLLNVASLTTFSVISATKTFKEQELQTGSVLIVQIWQQTNVKGSFGYLIFPAYARHQYTSTSLAIVNPLLGKALHEQAINGLYTDLALLSARKNAFRLTAHRSVLATVPFFKTAFESGMRESNMSSLVVELHAPPWTSERTLKDFLAFVYLRDSQVLGPVGIDGLTDLIRLADFYGFLELMDSVATEVTRKTYLLSDGNSLELLKILDLLEFPNRKRLETLLLDYVASNYSRIGQTQEFCDLFGTDLYKLIVERVDSKLNRKP